MECPSCKRLIVKPGDSCPFCNAALNPAVTENVAVHWFLSKFGNRAGAKTFTSDDFKSIADWKYGKTPSGNRSCRFRTSGGNVIECDSESEVRMLKYMERSGLFTDIGGQSLVIPYDSAFRFNLNYSPDIVALTKEGLILIAEVKPLIAMSYHMSIEKYSGLQEYCERNGFIYAMLDPENDYTTFEEFKVAEVPAAIKNLITPMEKKAVVSGKAYFHFGKENVDEWYKSVKHEYNRTEFELYIHVLIIQKGWFNTFDRGFNVYSRPVKLDINHNVADYI